METQDALSAIRRRSDEVLSQTVPTITTPKQIRAAELRGMLEFTELLISSGIEAPALLVCGIHSEAERMKEDPQSEQQEGGNLDNALSLAVRIKNMTRAILATDGTPKEFPQDFRVGVLETVKEAAEMAEIYITLEKRECSKMTQVKELGREPQVNKQLAEQVARKNMEPLEVYFMMEKRECSKEPANTEAREPQVSEQLAEQVARIFLCIWFVDDALSIVNADYAGKNDQGEQFAASMAGLGKDMAAELMNAIEELRGLLDLEALPFQGMRFRGRLESQGGHVNE